MNVLSRQYLSNHPVWKSVRSCTIILLAGACLEPYLPPPAKTPDGILVVDGFLVSNDSTIIKLSRTAAINYPEEPEPEPNALVEIESENGNRYGLINTSKGTYVASQLDLDPTDKYRLHIRTGDEYEYRSDYVPLRKSPSLDSIIWKEDMEHDRIEFNVYSHDQLNQTHYYLWTFDETWKYVSTGRSVYYFANNTIIPRKFAGELYECWKTNKPKNIYVNSTNSLSQDVVYNFPLFSIPQRSRKLYFGYSILVNQYAITSGAYDYWIITKKNSESLGGLFDPLPAQPKGNIRCINDPSQPCIGYFTATTVQKKRVFFTRQQVTGPTTGPYDETGYEFCEGKGFIMPLDEMSESTLKGMLIGDRQYDLITQELLGYGVSLEECIDCRFMGGVTLRPDYWRD